MWFLADKDWRGGWGWGIENCAKFRMYKIQNEKTLLWIVPQVSLVKIIISKVSL